MSSPQSCSHRNSVQNGPVDKFKALTGTIFVAMSVFMLPGYFPATFGQLLNNIWTIRGSGDCKIRSENPGVWPICDKILYAARPDPGIFCKVSSGRFFIVKARKPCCCLSCCPEAHLESWAGPIGGPSDNFLSFCTLFSGEVTYF